VLTDQHKTRACVRAAPYVCVSKDQLGPIGMYESAFHLNIKFKATFTCGF